MPNHVTQVVHFAGPKESIAKIKALLQSEDEGGGIDFQKIIPMPESMKITSGSSTDIGMAMVRSKAATLVEFFIESGTHQNSRDWLMQDMLKAFKPVSDQPELLTVETMLAAPLADIIKVGLAANFEAIVHGKQAVENLKEHGVKDWYHWSCKHWGTKWNSYSGSIDDESEDHLNIRFDTAWSPPVPIYAKLAEMFPDVTFTAKGVDEGWGFAFIIEGADGEIEETEIECYRTNQPFCEIYKDCYGAYPEDEEVDDSGMEALPAPEASSDSDTSKQTTH